MEQIIASHVVVAGWAASGSLSGEKGLKTFPNGNVLRFPANRAFQRSLEIRVKVAKLYV
jgi:hypothetical protein